MWPCWEPHIKDLRILVPARHNHKIIQKLRFDDYIGNLYSFNEIRS